MVNKDAVEKSQVFIVIPAFNEERHLGTVLESLVGLNHQIIVVDDGSTDKTADIAKLSNCILIQHRKNEGQGAALNTGIARAIREGADYLVTFDGDGQHGYHNISELLTPVLKGKVDVALGSRFKGRTIGLNGIKLLILRLAVLYTRISSGLSVTDAHNGLRAMNRRAMQQVFFSKTRRAHASEFLNILKTHRLSFEEVPVDIDYRTKSKSFWDFFKIAVSVILESRKKTGRAYLTNTARF